MNLPSAGLLRQARRTQPIVHSGNNHRSASRMLALLFIPLLLLIAPALHAQFGGSLNGTVTDQSGAVIPGATVVLTNPATQAAKTTTTNATGFYTFTELAPGNYKVKVTANGFEEEDFSDVAITAEQARGLDVKMTVGAAAQTVTVNGSLTPILNTTDAATSSTISAEM